MRCWHQNPRYPRLVVHVRIRLRRTEQSGLCSGQERHGDLFGTRVCQALRLLRPGRPERGAACSSSGRLDSGRLLLLQAAGGLESGSDHRGPDGKQMLADTQGYLYDSGYANGETIGHPAYRLSS